jgi:tetratricopeptide (TPR) repeat protein
VTRQRHCTKLRQLGCCLGATLLVSATAAAQRPDHATQLAAAAAFEQGRQAYAVGEYETALELIDSVYSVRPSAFAALWSARAMVKLGRFLDASARYRVATAPARPSGTDPQELAARYVARREHRDLVRRIPILAVRVELACDAQVYIHVDRGTPAPTSYGVLRQVDPGPHVVVGYCGGQVITREVELAPGDRLSVALRFERTPDWQDEHFEFQPAYRASSPRQYLAAADDEGVPENPYCALQ